MLRRPNGVGDAGDGGAAARSPTGAAGGHPALDPASAHTLAKDPPAAPRSRSAAPLRPHGPHLRLGPLLGQAATGIDSVGGEAARTAPEVRPGRVYSVAGAREVQKAGLGGLRPQARQAHRVGGQLVQPTRHLRLAVEPLLPGRRLGAVRRLPHGAGAVPLGGRLGAGHPTDGPPRARRRPRTEGVRAHAEGVPPIGEPYPVA